MLSWQVGDVKITRILEKEDTMPASFVFGEVATTDEIQKIDWLQPHFVHPDGMLKLSIHALLVETPTKRIIVDTCIGNDKHRDHAVFANLQTAFLKDLERAGFAPDTIDVVLCTHLHVDHVGWNTMLVDGRWEPTFPTARYLFGRTEFEHWTAEEAREPDDNGRAFQDSVKPVWEAGLVDLVETNHKVCEEVTLEPTLGHTPGHVSVRIRSKGQEALITGDSSHHPCQLARPEWASLFDSDQAESTRTRRRMFKELAGSEVLLIGTHFPTPTAGQVLSDGDAYRLKV